MNPDGGPLQSTQAAIHRNKARDQIMIVDITKKEEYDRRKKLAGIEARNRTASAARKAAKNVGFPLNPLPQDRGIDENVEKSINPLVEPPVVDEFLAKWKKGILPTIDIKPGTIFVQITAGKDPKAADQWQAVDKEHWQRAVDEKCWESWGDFDIVDLAFESDSFWFYLKPRPGAQAKDLEAEAEALRQQLNSEEPRGVFQSMILTAFGDASAPVRAVVDAAPVRLAPGYLEIGPDGGLLWRGPERTPLPNADGDGPSWTREAGALDLLVWKPLVRAWPDLVDAAGARETHAALVEGRPLPRSAPAEPVSRWHRLRIRSATKPVKVPDGNVVRPPDADRDRPDAQRPDEPDRKRSRRRRRLLRP